MFGRLAYRRLVVQQALRPNPLRASAAAGQWREFSSRQKLRKQKDNPFKVLSITEESKYAVAKRNFLKIAMENHPDTASAEGDDDRDRLKEIFISARRAFERLAEAPDGSILLVEEAEQMPDFDEWFQQETGHKNPFDVDMDPETMKEVAKMTEEMGGGLDRDGGMWTLAKMVTNAVNSGGDAASMLRLEAGAVRHRSIDGELRRKRRKR